ncbi:hypothetical protein [Nocardia crassostreae]|uniref:hypothetical protein n=1 Tax=Nocardia crassostreae TaxID=53428 RepID=UPI0012F8F61F|nr:hypothetical protein [Nocardia crassostreae]
MAVPRPGTALPMAVPSSGSGAPRSGISSVGCPGAPMAGRARSPGETGGTRGAGAWAVASPVVTMTVASEAKAAAA